MSKWGRMLIAMLLAALMCLSAAAGFAQGVLTLPESLKTIADEAFAGAQSITEIVLPEGVEAIGSRAFADSTIERINLPKSVASIADDAFEGSDVLATVTQDSYAHAWCTEQGMRVEVILEETAASSFAYAIADGVATITDFTGSETEVVVPAQIEGYPVTTIGASAFAGDTVLMDVTIPEGVTAIGDYAFAGCTALNGVHLPVSLQTIGAHAFDGCSNLNFVEFEKNVSSVGEDAFANCGEYIFFRAYVGTAPADYADAHGIFYEYNYDELYDGDYVYNVIGGEAAVVDYTGSEAALTIPAQLGEYKVTMIAPEAFDNREDITSVVIPEGVTLIATNAFAYCPNLASVTLPSTIIEFYGSAFSGTALTEIVLPENMDYIGFYAFEGCAQLEKVTVLSKDVEFDGDVFTNCGEGLTIYGYAGSTAQTFAQENGYAFIALDGGESTPDEPEDPAIEETPASSFAYTIADGEVTITDFTGSETEVVIPKAIEECPVTTIGNSAFAGKGVTSIVLQDGVTTLEGFNFTWCWRLESITIPATVTEIGDCPFLQSSSGLVVIGEAGSAAEAAAQKYAVDFQNQQTGEVTINGDYGYEIANGEATLTAYSGTETVLALPSTLGGCPVTAIGWHALINDTDVTSITIPEGVTSIGYGAMQYDSALTEVVLPESLTSLGGYAFYACSALERITIPAGVTDIGSNAFEGVAEGFTIYGYTGSAAETYANENGHAFVAVDGEATPDEPEESTPGEATPDEATPSEPEIEATPASSFTYTIADEAVTIDAFTGSETDVVVPKTIEGYPVTTIGENAFKGNTALTSVVLQDGITSTGEGAFMNCTALTSVKLSASMQTIGKTSFYGCIGLTGIDFPEGLLEVGEGAFMNCSSLVQAKLPDSVTTLWESAFRNCTALESFHYPLSLTTVDSPYGNPSYKIIDGCPLITEVVIPEGVTKVADYIFYGCTNLTNVTLPSTVQVIGRDAFNGCTGLVKMEFPDGLLEVQLGAFRGCTSLTEATLPDSVTTLWEAAFRNCTALESFHYPLSLTTVDSPYGNPSYKIIDGCPLITEVVIPEGVTKVADYIFYGCTNLTNVTLPSTVQVIGRDAFNGCTGLVKMEFPDGLLEVQLGAFMGCTSLTEATLPDSVTTLWEAAFRNCTALESFHYPLSLTTVDSPYGNASYGIIDGCTLITEIVLQEGLESIADHTFQGCTNIERVVLPQSMTYTGGFAFRNCTNLSEVQLPQNLVTIGENAFAGCTSIAEIELPDSLEIIEDAAFYGCSGLAEIIFPESLKSVLHSAFKNCENLARADLPDSVETLGHAVFENCASLESFRYPLSLTTIANPNPSNIITTTNLLTGCPLVTDIVIPEGVVSIPAHVFFGSAQIQRVQLPSTLEIIGRYAFVDCIGITEIVFPEGLKEVSHNAFGGCTNLTRADLPDSVEILGHNVFRNCVNLANFHYPLSLKEIDSPNPSNIITSTGLLENCELITDIVIPEGIVHIPDNVFYGSNEIERVHLSDTVRTIGQRAFLNCTSLEKIYIHPRVYEIGDRAFSNCPALTIHSEYDSYAIGYAQSNEIAYYYLSLTEARMLADTLYKGDHYAMNGYVRSNIGVSQVTATIYNADRTQVLQTVSVEPGETDYDLGGYVNNQLRFEELELGTYHFVLRASTTIEEEVFADTTFTLVPPPLRARVHNGELPVGFYDPSIPISGLLESNYAMDELRMEITRLNGTVVREATYYPGGTEFDLSSTAEVFDLTQLAVFEYILRITIQGNGESLVVYDTQFMPAAYDGVVDDTAFEAVVEYAGQTGSNAVFSQYLFRITDEVGSLGLEEIALLSITGYDGILTSEARDFLAQHGYDSYLVEIYKSEILMLLEQVADEGQIESVDFSLAEVVLKSLESYGKIKLEFIKSEIIDQIPELRQKDSIPFCESLQKQIDNLGYGVDAVKQSEAFINFIVSLTKNYENELAILDTVQGLIEGKTDPNYQRAMNEVRMSFRAKWISYLVDNWNAAVDELLKKAAEAAIKLTLEATVEFLEGKSSVTLPFAVVDFAKNLMLECSGANKAADDVKTLIARYASVSNANYAYTQAFEAVNGGDTSSETIQKFIVAFQYARQAYYRAYQVLEERRDAYSDERLEIINERYEIAALTIPGIDMPFNYDD